MALEAGVGEPGPAGRVNPRVGIVPVESPLAGRRHAATRVEERRELRVGDLVALDPHVGHVHAMQRRFLGRAVVAAHPERARLHQHDPVRGRRQP